MKLPSLTGTDGDRWLWAGGALAARGPLQVPHSRRIARDPEKEALDNPPEGRAESVRFADGTRLHVEVFGPDDAETVARRRQADAASHARRIAEMLPQLRRLTVLEH